MDTTTEGTIGVCVEALDDEGAPFNATMADPVVCHMVTAKGNEASKLIVKSWNETYWNRGNVTATPEDGEEIKSALYDGKALGLDEILAASEMAEEESTDEIAEAEFVVDTEIADASRTENTGTDGIDEEFET